MSNENLSAKPFRETFPRKEPWVHLRSCATYPSALMLQPPGCGRVVRVAQASPPASAAGVPPLGSEVWLASTLLLAPGRCENSQAGTPALRPFPVV